MGVSHLLLFLDAPISLEPQLIRPHAFCPILQSLILMLTNKLKPFIQLASLISDVLIATQLPSTNTFSFYWTTLLLQHCNELYCWLSFIASVEVSSRILPPQPLFFLEFDKNRNNFCASRAHVNRMNQPLDIFCPSFVFLQWQRPEQLRRRRCCRFWACPFLSRHLHV